MKFLFIAYAVIIASSQIQASSIDLKAGMTIKTSVTINAKKYLFNASDNIKEPLLIIDGNNITIDFDHAVLQGSNDKLNPDEFYGLSILVKNGSNNIVIKNANIHGFKVAILADSVKGLTIENCDLSYNWRQRLKSNLEREDISDWMSYHKNENDEWLRYGAAIYLKNVTHATISNNVVTGGQCALMMTKCEKALVTENNFSFNSGIGIGLYRSSDNSIYHNRLDYNVRGFSFGKYKRGQDSAGLLVFEQSSDNIFAFNTVTHSGDGFFLWAGQTTMDTGEGGCNDNFIYGNDFSYAPTNGIEVTFSRNLMMKNIIKECDHGIWGGYSYDSDITDNTFEGNRIGIAIEHGQNINIALNGFTNDLTGIKLWSREKQPADWIYAKKRNTESRNYWIASNRFTANQLAFDIMGTDTVVFSGNTKLLVKTNLQLGERAENIDTSRDDEFLDIEYQKDKRLKDFKVSQLPITMVPQGKKEIRMTEWGPYDFRYPLLWLQNIDSNDIYHFEVLGPVGKWEMGKIKGFEIIQKGETILPSFLTAKPTKGEMERSIQLKYTGGIFKNAFGMEEDNSSTHFFEYSEFLPEFTWTINWYKWNETHNPANNYEVFTRLFSEAPIHTMVAEKIDFTWWGTIGKNLPADSFATVATTKIFLPENNYQIGITADDFVKVFVDDIEVIDAWDTKFTELDENTHHRKTIKLRTGEHSFRIVHAENTGLATLQFYLTPIK